MIIRAKEEAIVQLEEEFKQYKNDIINEFDERKKTGTSAKDLVEKEQAMKVEELVQQHEQAKKRFGISSSWSEF